jgi:hypothetical protein
MIVIHHYLSGLISFTHEIAVPPLQEQKPRNHYRDRKTERQLTSKEDERIAGGRRSTFLNLQGNIGFSCGRC